MPIVVDSLTEAQRYYIRDGPLSLLLNFETLDQKLEFTVTEWPRVIGSVDRGRALFKTNKEIFGLGHIATQREDNEYHIRDDP